MPAKLSIIRYCFSSNHLRYRKAILICPVSKSVPVGQRGGHFIPDILFIIFPVNDKVRHVCLPKKPPIIFCSVSSLAQIKIKSSAMYFRNLSPLLQGTLVPAARLRHAAGVKRCGAGTRVWQGAPP